MSQTDGLASAILERPNPKFHACIIGISNYLQTDGPFKLARLTGAAIGACLFKEYLEKHFLPPCNATKGRIHLLLSPTIHEDEELKTAGYVEGQNYIQASHDAVQASLDQWANDCNTDPTDMGILYVAGHGVFTAENARWVFLADAPIAEDPYRQCINLDQIRRRMQMRCARSNYFVFDACADVGRNIPDRDDDSPSGIGLTRIVHGSPRGVRQHELWTAVRAGTSSYVLKPTDGPVLSVALLDLMRRDGGEFVGDNYMVTMNGINRKFKARAETYLKQTFDPVILGTHDPAGITAPFYPPEFKLVLLAATVAAPVKVRVLTLDGREKTPAQWIADENVDLTLPAGWYDLELTKGSDRVIKQVRVGGDTPPVNTVGVFP